MSGPLEAFSFSAASTTYGGMSEQIPFHASLELAQNPEPRCPCVLVLDCSASMAGQAIEELNRGVQTLVAELSKDRVASKRVEIAVVTFGKEVRLASDFYCTRRDHSAAFSSKRSDSHGGGDRESV